jgi:FkbH-like protein
LLACVSKNDEDVVRALWRYADHYPKDRLLSIDDFVTLRINWRDKAANVASICEELGFPSSAFVFVDDHPVERERVQTAFPDVWVLGEDPFSLRRTLLTDPRLQAAQITEESAARTDLVRAQLERDRQMNQAGDAAAFLEGLELVVTCDRPSGGPVLDRVRELLLRTTQFNTTGARPSADTLGARARGGEVFVCSAKDRFGDYGLVAAAVLEDEEIAAFVMSCRVIGLGVEQRFLAYVLDAAAERHASVVARIVETSRNGPSRHLYADAGFDYDGEAWRLSLARRRKTG